MSVKGISRIEEISKSLKRKGIVVSDEALSVVIDTAFSELMGHVIKLNDTIMELRNDVSELAKLNSSTNAEFAKMHSSMEKLLEDKRLADEEIERLKEKLMEAEANNNRDSSNSNKPSSWDHFDKPKPSPKRSVIFQAGKTRRNPEGKRVAKEQP